MDMTIDPAGIAGQLLPKDAGSQPDAADVALFASAMSARSPRPERVAVEAVGRAETGGATRVGIAATAALGDAHSMTQAQRALAEMRSRVDLIAKVAGTLSQSINKLTTMQ